MSAPAAGKSFTGTAQVVAAGGAAVAVAGVSVLDTSGAGNTVQVYAGTSTSGQLIGAVVLAANAAAVIDFSCPRSAQSDGVYVNCTGAVKGTVWLA